MHTSSSHSSSHSSYAPHFGQSHPLLKYLTPLRLAWIHQNLSSTQATPNQATSHQASSSQTTSNQTNGPNTTPKLLLTHQVIVDMGCGGGLMAVPLARQGAQVYGVDQCSQSLAQAADYAHAQEEILGPLPGSVHWIRGDIANVLASPVHDASNVLASSVHDAVCDASIGLGLPESDVIKGLCAMDLLEHFSNPFEILCQWAEHVAPGTWLAGSTLNRSFWTYMTALVASEKVLEWIPPGTHDWHNFITPQELRMMLHQSGFHQVTIMGATPSFPDVMIDMCQGKPPSTWSFSPSLSGYYFFFARRKG